METIDLLNEWRELFYPQEDPKETVIRTLGAFLRSCRNEFITLYHGTDAALPVLEKGLLPTSQNRRRSLQSSCGWVCLSVFPGAAEFFGRLGNPSKTIRVYAVTLCIRRLRADRDQLHNLRAYGDCNLKETLANSLVFGHGARVRGRISPLHIAIHSGV